MTKTSKVFLTISIIAFASTFAEAGGNFGWGILRPVGAITFIVFFITNLLAKEMALYEEDQRRKHGQAENLRKDSARIGPSRKAGRSSVTLETATAH